MGYTIALIIHLFCAIIFIGFVFADTFVLPVMRKVLSEQETQKVMEVVTMRARKIFPTSVLLIILSGGFMFSKYINSNEGVFNTNLQILLMIKVFLALIIVCGIIYSLSMKALKRKPHPIMKHFHKFVFVVGTCIVILAKLMFWL